ncbi:hypothetical protein A8709_26445 [Paenibacillus pectinilyticus]|uniref:Uncharacterized protein n=1 Tax=Paenibacillus pectinilyticus TaxID=512399 RepID=A0A1C1A1N8_9BACL|nr:hypothetical protein [Paenibacillus pectinilyticus]OCT14360.1 hypothetical protein A8709_26445 [Paenibacillus pectinilyticus]
MIDKTLEMELYKYNVYDAWQFVLNTSKAIDTAEFCMSVLFDLINKISSEHDEWKDNLFNNLMNQENDFKKVSITTKNLPNYKIQVF